jgi:hypothetical protein
MAMAEHVTSTQPEGTGMPSCSRDTPAAIYRLLKCWEVARQATWATAVVGLRVCNHQ